MITNQIEKFTESFIEFEELFFEHCKELPLNKDKLEFEMQFKEYLEKDKNNQIIFATLRDDKKPIGYFLGFISNSLHYKNYKSCTGDIFYIHPNYRGRLYSKRLFKFVENELKKTNVKTLFVGTNIGNNASDLLKLIGYKPIELISYKWLGG